jgi:hypothetical protein
MRAANDSASLRTQLDEVVTTLFACQGIVQLSLIALNQEPDEGDISMIGEALKGAFDFLERACMNIEEIEGAFCPRAKPPVDLGSTEAAGHA